MGIFFRTGRGAPGAEPDGSPRQHASPPARAGLGRVVGLFLLATVGTALLVGLDLLVPAVSKSGLQQNAERLAIVAVILWGAWLGLTRAGYAGRARSTAWLAVAVPLLVWQSLIWWLAAEGAPLLPAGDVLPLLIGLPLLLWPRKIGLLLDATPTAWLVGVQVYRIFGSVWIAGWLAGSCRAFSLCRPAWGTRSWAYWRCRSHCCCALVRAARAGSLSAGTCSASWTV